MSGWEGHMMQDMNGKLSQALASKPDAMMHARDAALAITAARIERENPEPRYTADQIASACIYAEVSDAAFESIMIALGAESRG